MFRMRDSFLWQLTVTVLFAWAAGMAALWLIVPDVIAADARKNVEFAATNTIGQIKKFRDYYTRNVVRKVLLDGNLKPSAQHQSNDKYIPLPATLIHDLGRLTQEDDISLSLYSPFPLSNRGDRTLDDFQQAAWLFLVKNPDAVFSRQELRENRPTVRVAVADRMGAACVNCHNSHADSPRSDWRIGDVRGIIEVATHVDTTIATGATLSNTIMAWVTTAAAAILILIIWATRWVSRPLLNLTDILGSVSGGETDIEIPHRQRRDEVGRLARGVQNFKDSVTEQKLRELEVLKAKEAAEVANAAKTRFLASASHDLRQPLQALNLFLGALGFANDDRQRGEIVERLKSSVTVLGDLLNALLDISNLEAGTITPKREVFELKRLLALGDEFRSLAEA